MINTYISVQKEWNAGWGFNNSLTLTFTLNGNAFDISTYTFALGIRRIGGGANLLSLAQGSGITNGGATGILTIQITKAQTETIDADSYFYTLNYTKSSLLYSALHGTFNLLDDYNPDDINNSVSIPVNIGGTNLDCEVTIAGSSQFLGYFVSLAALETAYPTAEEGNYAYVDEGVGTDVLTYIWDETDQAWVEGGGSGGVESVTGNVVDNTDPSNPVINAEELYLDFNEQTDDYILVLTDKDTKEVRANKATTITITVPPNSSVAFPIGTKIFVKQTGAGQLIIAQGVGVTITASSGALLAPDQNVLMALIKTGTNTWDLENGADSAGGSGDVVGPGSSTDNAIVLFDGLTGKLIKDSAKALSTVGGNIAALSNPGAISFLRINADNTVTARTASELRTDLNIIRHWKIRDNATSANHTGTTNETIVGSLSIPAGTVLANEIMRFVCTMTKTNTNAGFTARFYINTSVSLSGATQFAVIVGAGTTLFAKVARELVSKNSLSSWEVHPSNTTNADDIVTSTVTISTLSNDFANSQFLIVSVALTSASDIVNIRNLYVEGT